MGQGAKLLVLFLGAYAVFTTLTSGFLYDQFLNIGGYKSVTAKLKAQVEFLKTQVDRLQDEVGNLEIQVDRFEELVEELTDQNDRFEQSNINLAGNLTIFKGENDRLRITVDDYAEITDNLNSTVKEYQQQNEVLSDNVAQLEELNSRLENNIETLDNTIVDIDSTTEALTIALATATEIAANLTIEVDDLEEIKDDLNTSVITLTDNVQEYTVQVDKMDGTIQELSDIVSFLTTTAADVEQTFDATVSFIDSIIIQYRISAVYNKKFYWEAIRSNWRCDLDSVFGNKPFVEDVELPIGDEYYSGVMEYLDEVVFQKMCFNMTDFEAFLVTKYFPDFKGGDYLAPTGGNLTVQNLSSGIYYYTTTGLFKHYFGPQEDDFAGQVTGEEWEAANFDCDTLVDRGRGYSYFENRMDW